MPNNRSIRLSLFALTIGLLTGSLSSHGTVTAVSTSPTKQTEVAYEHAYGWEDSQCHKFVHLDHRKLASLIVKKTPVLPPNRLHDSELHGTVTIEASINDKGELAALRAIKGQPLALTSAMESVQHWQFRPYKQSDAAVCVVGELIVKYDFRSQK